jgi:phosphatidylglycerophosphate synthase
MDGAEPGDICRLRYGSFYSGSGSNVRPASYLTTHSARRLNPTLSSECPSWVFFYIGCSFLFYMMMDAIDGKQARKTGSSSPLGQLFDHGCDCVLSGVVAILQANSLGLGYSDALLLMSSMQIAFFSGMWEEKYVGVCRTTVWGLVGTTEYMLVFIGSQFFAGIYPTIRASPDFQKYMVFFFVISGIAGCVFCVISVLKTVDWRVTFLKGLVPIFFINIAFNLVKSDHIHSLLPLLLLACINAYLIIQMIISTMSKTEFSATQSAAVTVPGIVIFAFRDSPWINTFFLIYSGFFMSHFGKYMLTAIGEISSYLGIEVFRIKPMVNEIAAKKSS